jgi:hypothetical protein
MIQRNTFDLSEAIRLNQTLDVWMIQRNTFDLSEAIRLNQMHYV